jgi:hypothetical protein
MAGSDDPSVVVRAGGRPQYGTERFADTPLPPGHRGR